jgi:hypothetical protein
VLPPAAVREAPPLYPRGPWLRFGLCCPAPSSLTTTPSASLAGTRRLHSLAAYTPRLRCTGAPRRPTRPSLLSLLCCPHAPLTLHRWVPRALPVVCNASGTRLPRTIIESPPTKPVSASNPRRGYAFRCCIIRVMLRLACLPGPPDWLRRSEVICAPLRLLRTVVIPAFDADCRQATLGIRLDGRTGNLPSSGLSPDKSQQLVRLHDSPHKAPT